MSKKNPKINLPKPEPKPNVPLEPRPGTTIPLGSPNDRGSRPKR
jgi:hypothetical protein